MGLKRKREVKTKQNKTKTFKVRSLGDRNANQSPVASSLEWPRSSCLCLWTARWKCVPSHLVLSGAGNQTQCFFMPGKHSTNWATISSLGYNSEFPFRVNSLPWAWSYNRYRRGALWHWRFTLWIMTLTTTPSCFNNKNKENQRIGL